MRARAIHFVLLVLLLLAAPIDGRRHRYGYSGRRQQQQRQPKQPTMQEVAARANAAADRAEAEAAAARAAADAAQQAAMRRPRRGTFGSTSVVATSRKKKAEPPLELDDGISAERGGRREQQVLFFPRHRPTPAPHALSRSFSPAQSDERSWPPKWSQPIVIVGTLWYSTMFF